MHAPQSNPHPSSDLPKRTPQKAQNPKLIVPPLAAALAIIGCSSTSVDTPSEPATPRVFTDPEFFYGYWKLICQDGTSVSLDFDPGQFWGTAQMLSLNTGGHTARVELTAYEAAILEEAIQNGDIVDEKSLELFLLDLAMDQTSKPREFAFGHFEMERPECLEGRQETAREMDSNAWSSGSRGGLVDGALSFRQRQWIDTESLFGLLATSSWGDVDRDGNMDLFVLRLDQGYSGGLELERLDACPNQDRWAQDEDEPISLDVDGKWLDALTMPRTGAEAQVWLSTTPPCLGEELPIDF